MFGLVPVEKIEIKYPNKGHDSPYASSFPSGVHATSVVEGVGLFLFALYHVAIIIVLTNMLIAMMSHSFEAIQVSECPALLLTSVSPSVCPSVRPSVPCLRFSRSRKAVETNLLQTLRWAILTREQIWGLKVKFTGNENRFLLIFSSKVMDRFTSNQDENDHGPIVHRQVHFTCGNASFMWYFSVIIRNIPILEGRMSQRPSGRASTCLLRVVVICDVWSFRRTVTLSGSLRGRSCGWTTLTRVALCRYRSTWFRHPSRCVTPGAVLVMCVETMRIEADIYTQANDRPSSR